jgi:hypothetical protein
MNEKQVQVNGKSLKIKAGNLNLELYKIKHIDEIIGLEDFHPINSIFLNNNNLSSLIG